MAVELPAKGKSTVNTYTVAGDEVAGEQHQLVVLEFGASGDLARVSTSAPLPVALTPDAGASYAPDAADSTAYEASRVIKATAGKLFLVTGYNSLASSQFIQIHDAAALPADGVAPKILLRVGPSQNFEWQAGQWGRYFSTGIVICNSSTGPTKTIGAADCWFNALYK